jgi:hypothetical protein
MDDCWSALHYKFWLGYINKYTLIKKQDRQKPLNEYRQKEHRTSRKIYEMTVHEKKTKKPNKRKEENKNI